MNSQSLGIYIHIPYCIRKCPYCGFYSNGIGLGKSREKGDEIEGYVERLLREIELGAKEYSDSYGKAGKEVGNLDAGISHGIGDSPIVDSIFIGGGTPSLLTGDEACRILGKIGERFDVTMDAEITLESNPGTVNREKLEAYQKAGINRLSIGVQSFDDEVLKTLGRIHGAMEAEGAFLLAREAGFKNINLDLMFGIPGQTMNMWEETLRKAISLNPEHLSFYSLQIEEGTPYYESFMAGKFNELPDEIDRDMYHRALELLKEAGYKHYEISNASKSGFECRHNLKYWTGKEYLGFGDSASSYIKGTRYTSVNGNKNEYYVNSIFDDMSEYTFTGLRLRSGVNYGAFKAKFGLDFREAFSDRWEELKEFFDSGALVQLVDIEGNPMSLRLTEKGIDVSNRIMAVFV